LAALTAAACWLAVHLVVCSAPQIFSQADRAKQASGQRTFAVGTPHLDSTAWAVGAAYVPMSLAWSSHSPPTSVPVPITRTDKEAARTE